jgi:hypothetical protein
VSRNRRSNASTNIRCFGPDVETALTQETVGLSSITRLVGGNQKYFHVSKPEEEGGSGQKREAKQKLLMDFSFFVCSTVHIFW